MTSTTHYAIFGGTILIFSLSPKSTSTSTFQKLGGDFEGDFADFDGGMTDHVSGHVQT
jgi:hypothetical protein